MHEQSQIAMPKAARAHKGSQPQTAISAIESAAYARDLLGGLGAMAARHRQYRLVELLQAAADEAERLSTNSTGASTE
jgi:hypothetical protein